MTFTHLHVHSGYTFMESTITIPQLIERAKQLNFKALALTDHHVLHGAVEFYQAALQAQIKPIIGMTVTVIDPSEQEETLILLAKNNAGYRELIQLSTLIQVEKLRAVPWELLQRNLKNVIVIVQLNDGHVYTLLLEQEIVAASHYLQAHVEHFTDVYLGIDATFLTKQPIVYKNLHHLIDNITIPLVAIHDVVYLKETDYLAYECLQAMKVGRRWAIPEKIASDGRYLQSSEQIVAAHTQFFPEAVKRTAEIVKKCHVSLNFHQQLLPSYPVPDNISASQYLKNICQENMESKYSLITEEMTERLTYELSVIEQMAFSDYFLIVWDFVKFAKEKGISVGPGRGSAAGSFVAYLLGITNVDPLAYDLLFERFLNPERESMPDIDIDFADHRRDEVIQYVREKYGQEHVAQIITFGTFGTRSVLRELFKTLGTSQQDVYFILNQIPAQTTMSLKQSVLASDQLKQYIQQSHELRLLFKIAHTLEGLPRHASTHAAGVIISDERLPRVIPLTIGANETYMTQYAMDELEALGLLKIDFLGLRNLSLIERMVTSIQRRGKNKAHFSLENIPEDDAKTFALLQNGQTDGVFQLESAGMKDVLRKLKPTSLEDIVAVNALYRPGPMEYISTFIQRKHGQEQTTYLHEQMAPILASTYGVLVYQEQMMQIVHHFAGFSLGEADIFRRTLSSKNKSNIAHQKDLFIAGCEQEGFSVTEAEEIFHWLLKFSNYSFNRSHAVAYSKISYQLAYLKAHYPEHFFAELLTSAVNSEKRLNQYVMDMRQLAITLLPPAINRSYGRFSVEDGKIRMGLLSIKGIGYQVMREIIDKRREGPFKSLFDFCLRISLKIVNRQTIEHLILVGAFNEFSKNRASLLATLDQAIDQAELFKEFQEQPSLFADQFDFTESYVSRKDFTLMEKLSFEREYLGMYVSSHPLANQRDSLADSGYDTLLEASERVGQRSLKSVVMIQEVRVIRTRRGDQMAFLQLSDEFSEMDAVVFPDLFQKVQHWLKEEMFVKVKGKIETRHHKLQFVIQGMEPFNVSSSTQANEQLFIKITSLSHAEALAIIQRVANKYPGTTPVFVYVASEKQTYKLQDSYQLDTQEACVQLLQHEFGEANVVLKK